MLSEKVLLDTYIHLEFSGGRYVKEMKKTNVLTCVLSSSSSSHILNVNLLTDFPPILPNAYPPPLPATSLPLDTGHTCKHVGYDQFDPLSWNSDCAPDTSDWIKTGDLKTCGLNSGYPEVHT